MIRWLITYYPLNSSGRRSLQLAAEESAANGTRKVVKEHPGPGAKVTGPFLIITPYLFHSRYKYYFILE